MTKVYESTEKCCGCALCAQKCPQKAIDMKMENGFLYPVIAQKKCIDCGLCQKVCSFNNQLQMTSSESKSFAAKIRDDSIRMKSSSGGAFTVLSDAILSLGGIVVGADFTEKMKVCHKVAETSTDRDRMRGAKYVQSDISAVYTPIKAALDKKKYVLFSGTPCQVAAVKNAFSNHDLLLTIDLICHGVPSPEMWEKYVIYIEEKYKKKIAYFSFRDKTKSWRQYAPRIIFTDGTQVGANNISGSFIELFRYDVHMRPSCEICPYASLSRQGDITIGDFWGIEKCFPELDDDKGVSAVIINTEKGEQFISSLEKHMELRACSVDQIAERQANMHRPSKSSNKAVVFKEDFLQLPFDKVLKKYTRVGLKRRVIDVAKKIMKK